MRRRGFLMGVGATTGLAAAHKPARSTVPGVDWGRGDVLIEIEAVALMPNK